MAVTATEFARVGVGLRVEAEHVANAGEPGHSPIGVEVVGVPMRHEHRGRLVVQFLRVQVPWPGRV
jgi:hypothetical protein